MVKYAPYNFSPKKRYAPAKKSTKKLMPKKTLEAVWVSNGDNDSDFAHDTTKSNGRDVDESGGRKPSCFLALRYPVDRAGYHSIKCRYCGNRTVLTTTGASDDPKSIRMACQHGPKS